MGEPTVPGQRADRPVTTGAVSSRALGPRWRRSLGAMTRPGRVGITAFINRNLLGRANLPGGLSLIEPRSEGPLSDGYLSVVGFR